MRDTDASGSARNAKRLCSCRFAGLAPVVLVLLATFFSCTLVNVASPNDPDQSYRDGVAAFQRGERDAAIQILLPLAEKGHTAAQITLGQIYYKGARYNDDVREAEKWFRLAAEKGIALAQFAVGMILNQRWGRNPDENDEEYAEALKWYRLAAEQDFAPAQAALANLLMFDKTKRREAFQWFLKAANQGYVEAYARVSESYQLGRGVEKSEAEAFRWARLAADAGNSGGYWKLARMYEKGSGVGQDNVQAYMWYDIVAQTNNDKSAAIYRDIVAGRMTPEQIAEAQRLAQEWMAAHPK